MKLNITELRDMVAKAVRRTMREARKPKLPAERSEESVAAQRDRHVRALPGYAHSAPLDMSKPLGKRSLPKRQGASNIGNWTSESRGGRGIGLAGPRPAPVPPPPSQASQGSGGGEGHREVMFRELVNQGIPRDKAARVAQALWNRSMGESAIRKLVSMIVDEEICAARNR